ncbi:hypothetical protein [Enterobacter cloacae complex sp. 279F5]
MSNIDKQALREEFQFMRSIYSDPADHERQLIYIAAEALLDELEAKDKRNERALSLMSDANTENVWEIIGRLKVVISGDYRSEAEIAAAGRGEAS